MKKHLISIVVPVHNEAGNLHELYRRIKASVGLTPHEFELILVDDGSTDNSLDVMEKLAKPGRNIIVVELARNFGKEIALSAGLHHTSGQAALLLDADLEHPPELIPQFIEKWLDGADVIIGIRCSNQYTWFKRVSSAWFNRFLKSISDIDMVVDATDYRLLDRMVIDEFNRFTERNRMARGLIDWLGFRRDFIHFDAGRRSSGKPNYSTIKLIRLALNSIISLSLFPMKIAGYLGLIIMLVSIPLGSFIVLDRYILNDQFGFNFSGSAILAAIMLFLIGIVLIAQGLIALYIANIHDEVVNRPLYVVRKPRKSRRQ